MATYKNSQFEPAISDGTLRVMRNRVYPAFTDKQVQCDASWEQVKKYWRQDVEWLTQEYNKEKARKP